MKKQLLVLGILISILTTACSFFQKDSFEGKWQLKLSGSIEETFDFAVGEDNSFTVNKMISYGSRDYDVELKGKIGKDGKLSAEIIASGQSMGNLDGLFTYETGKGKWNASILYGEWSAIKK